MADPKENLMTDHKQPTTTNKRMNVTPEQAAELLARVENAHPSVLQEYMDWADVAEALRVIASLHYEYAVADGHDDDPVYVMFDDYNIIDYVSLEFAHWWKTEKEAQNLVDDLYEDDEESTAHVVRRLVSVEPETAG